MSNESNLSLNNAFNSSGYSLKDLSEHDDVNITIHNPGDEPIVRVRDIEAERPQQGSRQRKNEFEPYINGDITNISQFTSKNIERPKQIRGDEDFTDSKGDISALLQKEPHNYQQKFYPGWFDNSSIHDTEILALPEFFEGGLLTPDDYLKCRNIILEHYRSHPDYYLTVTSCKSKLPQLDLVTLVRIHGFLEANKLINDTNDPRRKIFDPFIEISPEAQLLPHSQRDYRDISRDDLQFLKNLVYDASVTKNVGKLWDISVEDPLNADNRKKYDCSTCNVDCSEIRYQSLKFKDVQLCIDCFLEGKFTAALSSGDFLRVDESSNDLNMEEEWSDMEVLKLLEGVEKFDDDWLLISEHVGSRTKEQCITKFLQLPINDEFLSTRPTQTELEEIPFGGTENPVMTIISFLSGHVNSGVASAAAKSALRVLLESGEDNKDNVDIKNVESEKMSDTAKTELALNENTSLENTNRKRDTEYMEVESITNTEETENIEASQKKVKLNKNTGAFSKETMVKASSVALKGAVETAKKLASYENEEIQHWARLAVKTTIEKLSLKLQQYDALETSLENEHEEMEKQAAVLASSIETLVTQYHPEFQNDQTLHNSFNIPQSQ